MALHVITEIDEAVHEPEPGGAQQEHEKDYHNRNWFHGHPVAMKPANKHN